MATNNGNDIEKRLWATADQLWANSGLRPAEFSTPVLGLIFLRYAEKRFAEVEERIGPVGSGGSMSSSDGFVVEVLSAISTSIQVGLVRRGRVCKSLGRVDYFAPIGARASRW